MATIEELIAQNAQLRDQAFRDASLLTDGAKTKTFTTAVIILAVVCVASIALIAILRPGDTSTGTLILGVLVPVITAFLSAAIRQVHQAVNGRLTELLDITARASKAEGQLERRAVERPVEPPLPPPITP